MKREELLKKLKEHARRTERLRKDLRYKNVLGFFVQIGLLRTNEKVPRVGNRHIPIKDVLWAGREIEPRILEVLPAAFARLPKRFQYTPKEVGELENVIKNIRENCPTGPEFMGIPYEKVRAWYEYPFADKRTKIPGEKKIARNFRLKPEVVERLDRLAQAKRMSATELIEKMILDS